MENILYKYRGLESFRNFVDIILKNRLYAAQYDTLNDPMEGSLYSNGILLDDSLEEKLKEDLDEKRKKIKICSLSKDSNNELMWAHYAEGHRGVAIGLRIKPKYEVRSIMYNGPIKVEKWQNEEIPIIDMFCRKHQVWSYENEVRAFTVDGTKYIDIEIIEVIIGKVMSTQNYSFIKNLIEKINPNIRIIKAEK